MVAIVTGRSTGLERSSAWVLGSRGQLGSAGFGRDSEGVYVNAASGNLVVTRQDEFLIGKGPDVALSRTYNSLAASDGDNNDDWQMSVYRKVVGSYGAASVVRMDWDGSDTVYTRVGSSSTYRATDGAGAYDYLTWSGSQWSWTDGDSRVTETYDGAGKLLNTSDTDGNSLTYYYDAPTGLVTSVVNANGEHTDLSYNLTTKQLNQIVTYAATQTTRIFYEYDGSGRLSVVKVNLDPSDNSKTTGANYTTSYTYDGTSNRVASISQLDGSSISFTYALIGADYKVASYTQTVAAGVTRTTSFDYGTPGRTIVTDPAGQKTILFYNGNNELTQIGYPPENGNTAPRFVQFLYNGNGDILQASTGPGHVVYYDYNSEGDVTLERDNMGNTVSRTYGSKNELLTETRYTYVDPDGFGANQPSGGLTTRYAYDSENHLRYVVSAAGLVTQYEYNAPGQQTAVNEYAGDAYSLAGLADNVSIAESTLTSWVTGLDKTTARRTETAYDLRGNVTTITSYSKLLSNGLFDTSSERTQTNYVYDQFGNLLSRQVTGASASEVFTYDGLGRTLTATDLAGGVTRTSFVDQYAQTVLTHANGLSDVSTYNKAGELIAYSQSVAGANLIDVTGWPGNPGSVPGGQATVPGWMNPGGFTDETSWASTIGPDGIPVVAMHAGQLDASQEGGGNYTHEIAIDGSKAYEFTYYFKLSDLDKHYLYFGLSASAGAAFVENAANGVDDANPYFFYSPYGQGANFTTDHWYKVVAYVLPQGAAAPTTPLGGVYDATTGQKVVDVTNTYRWNAERPGNTVHSRFFDYYGEANQQYSTYFYQPEMRQVTMPTATGPDSHTSLYRYDNLGNLRMTVDPTGRRAYMMYDSVGRKVADIDADGSVTEFRYDGNDQVTSTTRYVNKLSAGQIASLVDANGNPTSASFASLRPTAHADDKWSWQVFDNAGRLVQTIDGAGATSTFSYDAASRLLATKSYANKLSGTQLAALKAEAGNPNLWTAPQNGGLWAYYNVAQSSATAIDGSNAYKFTVQADSWEAVVGDTVTVAAGDTVVSTLWLKGSGSTTTDAFGLYGVNTGWGADYAHPDAVVAITSGPGTILQSGSYVYISNLSTTEATRITISRTYLQADLTSPYLYVRTGDSFAGATGASTIIAAPVLSRTHASAIYLPTADPANDRGTRSFYDADDRVIATLDGAGGLTQFTYDKSGRKITEIGSAKAAASGLWADGTLSQLQGSVGTSSADRRVDYVYDARGFQRFTIDATGRPTETVYDFAGRAIRTVDYAGPIATAASYSLAYVTAQLTSTGLATNAANRIGRITYDGAGRAAFSIDASGAVSAFTYDSLGNVIKQVRYATAYTTAGDQSLATMQSWATSQAGNSANRTDRIVYDAFGRTAYTVDAEGYVSETQYDAADRITKQIRYAAAYSVSDGATKESLAATIGTLPVTAVVTSYAYDADGLTSDVTDGTGAIVHYTYDSFGQVIDTVVAYGTADATTMRRAYDVLGQVTSEIRGYGTGAAATTAFTYDALGNVVTATDARGYATTRTYDTVGRVLTVSVPVDATAGNNLVTTNEYDAFGDLVKSSLNQLPDAANSYHYYDSLGRMVLDVDAGRYATRTNYNVFGEISSVVRYALALGSEPVTGTQPTITTNAADATTSFTYDKNGRLLTSTDAEGKDEAYVLNLFGERTKARNKLGSGLVSTDPTFDNFAKTYTYDKLGRLLSETLPVAAQKADGTTQAASIVTKYEYDSRGNRTRLAEAFGLLEQRITNYVYDKANRVTQVTHDQVQAVSTDLLTLTTVTPTETYTYNVRGDLLQSVDAGGGKTLYYYDALGRQTTTVSAVGTLSAYSYDGNGNLIATRVYGDAVTVPGSPGGSPPAPINGSNYRETSYVFDRANRLISTAIGSLRTGVYNGSTYAFTTGTVSNDMLYSRYRVTRDVDGSGNATWTWFDKLGHRIAQIDRESYLTNWTLDGNGNVTSETRYATKITGAFSEATAASALAALAGTSAADRTTSFTYDRNGRRLTEARAGVYASTVSGAGALSSATVTATVAYTYNALGEVLTKTEATGDLTSYGYDNAGRLIWTKDPTMTENGGASVRRMTETFYNGLGDVVRTEVNKEGGVSTDDRVTTMTYGAGGRLATLTDAVGFVHNYFYDAAGRVMKDSYTRLKSDGATNVTEATGYRYDLAGRLITQAKATWNGSAWAFSAATRLRYNSFGEVTGRGLTGGPNDTAVYQEVIDYDEAGRVWRSTASDGAVKIMFYDKSGNQTLLLSSTGADLSGYTAASAAATIVAAGGGTSIANAVTTVIRLDKRGLQTEVLQPDRQLRYNGSGFDTALIKSTRTYNAFGEVLTEVDPRGYLAGADPNAFKVDYTYNAMGRLIKKESPAVSWTSEAGVTASNRPTEEYYYDAGGRLVAVKDANNGVTTRQLLAGTGYGDEEALVTADFHPDGGVARLYFNVWRDAMVIRNELFTGANYAEADEYRFYDKNGQVTSVTQRGGLISDYYTYDGLGRRTRHYNSQLTSAVVERTDYDVEGRVTLQTDFSNTGPSYAYTWSPTAATGTLGTFGAWERTTTSIDGTYAVDDTDYFGHLVWRRDRGGHTYSYAFDKGGRTTSMTTSAGGSQTISYLNTGLVYQNVDAAGSGQNSITAKYGYDAAGNRTYEGYTGTVYSFYYPSGTTSASTTLQNATISYDAMNRITSFVDKDAGGTTRITVTTSYDLNGNVRRVQTSYPNIVSGGAASTDIWNRYDSMNRMVVAEGIQSGSTILRGTTGLDITYDAASRRRTQTRNAQLTGLAQTWVPDPGYMEQYDDGTGEWHMHQELRPVWYDGDRREEYEYRGDGALMNVKFAETGYVDNGDGSVSGTGVMGAANLRGEYQRDAMGRITRYREWDNWNTVSRDRYSIVYDSRNNVTSESVSQRKVSGGGVGTITTYVTNTVNTYTNGLLTFTSNDEWKNGYDEGSNGTPDTSMSYSYAYWDDARVSSTSFDGDTNSGSNPIFSSSYYFDGEGRVGAVDINDGRRRTVSFAYAPEGQVLSRKERSAASANPEDQRYFVSGLQIGEITNNGFYDPDLQDYAQSLTQRSWENNTTAGPFRYNSPSPTLRGTFGVTGGYDYINPTGDGSRSTGTRYTVGGGNESLESIAASTWGDASLWYMIAQANGLGAGATLIAGQSLIIPDRVSNIHNNSSTFEVYDPNKAMGDLSPTTPKPAKKGAKCGILGQILLIAVAVAITMIIKVPVTNMITGLLAGGGAVTAGVATAGGIIGAVATGAIASAASQAVGVATGIQDKFSWKGVALSALSAGITQGIGGSELIKGAGDFVNDVARGALGNALTQGVGVVTGLQKSFSWTGVAVAGVAAGVTGAVSRSLPGRGASFDFQGRHYNWAPTDLNLQLSGAAGSLAGAAAQSLITGTDFGDNLRAVLPEIIGSTIGLVAAKAVQRIGQTHGDDGGDPPPEAQAAPAGGAATPPGAAAGPAPTTPAGAPTGVVGVDVQYPVGTTITGADGTTYVTGPVGGQVPASQLLSDHQHGGGHANVTYVATPIQPLGTTEASAAVNIDIAVMTGGDRSVIVRNLELLPRQALLFLAGRHVKFVATQSSVVQYLPGLTGVRPRGHTRYDDMGRPPLWDFTSGTSVGNVVVVGTDGLYHTGSTNYILHELGHWIDHALGNASSKKAFRDRYNAATGAAEHPLDPLEESYYSLHGNGPHNAYLSESFAESFAAIYGGGNPVMKNRYWNGYLGNTFVNGRPSFVSYWQNLWH